MDELDRADFSDRCEQTDLFNAKEDRAHMGGLPSITIEVRSERSSVDAGTIRAHQRRGFFPSLREY
jgi:hypothetical protein